MEVQKYLKGLASSIPEILMELLLITLIVGTLLLVSQKGIKYGLKSSLKLFLAGYILILCCSTIVFRKTRRVVNYDLIPFRSYCEILNGKTEYLLPQVIMNILVFIPLGVLLTASFHTMKLWQLLLLGIGLSVIIEISQLFFHKGLCEIDDVIHNGMGCMIGVVLARCLKKTVVE